MSVVGKGAALAALLAAGVLLAAALAGGGSAADTITTTTETSTQVTTETATEPTTVTATTTVAETTTETVESTATTPTTDTTATTGSSGSSTPTWVWVLLGLAAVGLVVLAILLLRRGQPELSPAERTRLLQAAVNSWVGQGWAIQSQTADSAVLWRGKEQVLVTVDSLGHVATRPLSGGA